MIEEIFVVDNYDKVLYGDPLRFPLHAAYPVHEIDGLQLMQMRVNDVRIAVLYSFTDSFSLLNYMKRLKSRLERRLGSVNARSILDNYFLLFELLNKKEGVVFEKREKNLIPSISSNNAYLDVVECSNVVMEGGKIIVNRTTGNCYLDTSFADNRALKLIVKGPSTCSKIVYKSNGIISEKLNGMEVKVRSGNVRAAAFGYWIQDGVEPLVEVKRVEGGYMAICAKHVVFEYLEICFPVPPMASKVVRSHASGEGIYDEKENVFRWIFRNMVLRREVIDYRVELFERCEDLRPITVKFHVKEASRAGVRIERAECVGDSETHFWIRYNVCNGRYEIRT